MDALEANIEQEEKFTDVLHSPTRVFRTVAHNVPLLKFELIEWSEDNGEPKYTDLQKEWYEYRSASGIWAISTFSKQIPYSHSYRISSGCSQLGVENGIVQN